MRKKREEIKSWLLENCVDEDGSLDLSELDFSDFEGNVHISFMKVKKTLFQDCQKVGIDLYQDCHTVEGNLWQDNQKVEGNLYQSNQKVSGKTHE